MHYLKISFGILLALSASRFVPHPPNFTSLIALSFYVPAILGIAYIPALLSAFFLTDLIIGNHNLVFFTWGSVVMIGLISKFFINNIIYRIIGSLVSVLIFFIFTNLGVWLLGDIYDLSLNGLLNCYFLALPFLGNTFISTIIFCLLIEIIIYFYLNKKYLIKKTF